MYFGICVFRIHHTGQEAKNRSFRPGSALPCDAAMRSGEVPFWSFGRFVAVLQGAQRAAQEAGKTSRGGAWEPQVWYECGPT